MLVKFVINTRHGSYEEVQEVPDTASDADLGDIMVEIVGETYWEKISA